MFATSPRNAGREDLGCPCGCRVTQRRKRSNARSAAYYSTDYGRKRKRILNQQRAFRDRSVSPCLSFKIDRSLLIYLAWVLSIVEGRRVERAEVQVALMRILRQRSIGERASVAYDAGILLEHPP